MPLYGSAPEWNTRMPPISTRLPTFPWDRLEPYRATALAHPEGVVDLSVGTPVDPVPAVVREALAAAADSPGYPQTSGTAALREAIAGWLRDRLGVTGADPAAVLPTIGSKELVGALPALLGLTGDDQVAYPSLAYPTYQIGALIAGAEPVPCEDPTRLDVPKRAGGRLKLLWLNSPANPTGQVLTAAELRSIVTWARERGVLVASDECYAEFGWDAEPVSVLHPEVCGGSHEGLLAVHSLSKRSNLAGYRAAFLAGDPAVVRELLAVRRHAGMMVPGPVQAAMVAALGDTDHVRLQRERYGRRRAALRAALEAAGFRIAHSEAGLYLWATRGESCWDTVGALAKDGILVAPGEFYGRGPAGEQSIRIAFTATDERVGAAVRRLGTTG